MYPLSRRMADPGNEKKRIKIKIEHGRIIFRPQQKQQQNNIIPFPSFITNKTEQKLYEKTKHKNKLTACKEKWPIPVKARKE